MTLLLLLVRPALQGLLDLLAMRLRLLDLPAPLVRLGPQAMLQLLRDQLALQVI